MSCESIFFVFFSLSLTALAVLGRGICGLGHVDTVVAIGAEGGHFAGVQCFARNDPVYLCMDIYVSVLNTV
jgi:hypothetical protein